MDAVSALSSHAGFAKRKARSLQLLGQVREEIRSYARLSSENITVFAAGSLGRYEFGIKSDLDLFIILESDGSEQASNLPKLEEIRLLAQAIQLNENLKLPEFSNDARFLKVYP